MTQNYVQICGALGESLKHTTFMMDLHAAEDETKDLSTYSFEGRDKNAPPLIEWKDRRYFGAECTTIQNVPVGKHILGIQRNTTLKRDHVNSVIHVITW